MAASAAIPTPATAMRWTWLPGARDWELGIGYFSFAIKARFLSFSLQSSLLSPQSFFLDHRPHHRIMKRGTKRFDLVIITSWVNPIAQDDDMHLPFEINPY